MKFWTKSLMSRLVVYFLLLSVLTVFFMGAIAFQSAKTSIQQLVFDRLEVTATLKEEALNLWVENQKNATVSLAQLPDLQTAAEILLTANSSSQEWRDAYTQIKQYMASALAAKPELLEVQLLTATGGQIIFSTDPQSERQYRFKEKYFQEGRYHTFVQNVYFSSHTNKPTLTISTPLKGSDQDIFGVLVAHLNLKKMEEIVFDKTGLGKSGETYLVDRSQMFVTAERFGRNDFPIRVNSLGIEAALAGKDGHKMYLNYAGIPVIGVYRWLDQQQLALLVEMHQSEADAPAHRLAWIILSVGLTSAVLLAIGVYILARQITRPILAITETAIQVSDGDFTLVAPVITDDEIGQLAIAFNRMTRQLRRLYAGLEEKLALLQHKEMQLKDSLNQLKTEKKISELQKNQLTQAYREITLLNQRLKTENLDLMAELRVQNQRLYQLLEAIPLGVIVLDATGKLYYTNQVVQELLGAEILFSDPPLQLNVYSNSPSETKNPYVLENLPIFKALHEGIGSIDKLEVEHLDRIVPLQTWGTPIYDESGQIVYAIGVFQDITERRRAEEERQQFIEEMFEINCNLELALDEEEQLTDAAGRFVPNQFLSFLGYESLVDVKSGDAVQKEMSILFSDIRSFTQMSEQMTPEDNFKFINAYLSRMEPAITENRGFIDKYIGDAIMALFGGSADDAVKAGISMLQRLTEYNLTRQRPERPPISIGIGINTGDLMLGIVGGQHRMDSTVISDAVNLGSRLEELSKRYGIPLLISEHTFLRLEDPNVYCFRVIDKVRVKGKSEMVSVFEIFDADPPILYQKKVATKTLFEQALTLYHLEAFPESAQCFEACLRENPSDQVAQIYLQRVIQSLSM
ncbi:Adenylate/guanylate cyclase [Planktothrix serta PCC 8927]|uniref:Adenylate/guanylate cyclase n=2 Tax=Planktothrix TaxID=54304 RepID=A0A7Z9E044_9CYAN|nr:Adenylate/guanylate cyclase [Planktothrix serta PCC 8927]